MGEMVLKAVIGCLDKATATEIHKLAADSAVRCDKSIETYSREWVREKGGDRDPLFGSTVFQVRIAAEAGVIGKILAVYSEHLGKAWNRGATAAADGRVWFST